MSCAEGRAAVASRVRCAASAHRLHRLHCLLACLLGSAGPWVRPALVRWAQQEGATTRRHDSSTARQRGPKHLPSGAYGPWLVARDRSAAAAACEGAAVPGAGRSARHRMLNAKALGTGDWGPGLSQPASAASQGSGTTPEAAGAQRAPRHARLWRPSSNSSSRSSSSSSGIPSSSRRRKFVGRSRYSGTAVQRYGGR